MKKCVALFAIIVVGASASPADAKGFLSALLRGGARGRSERRYPCWRTIARSYDVRRRTRLRSSS